MRQSIFAGAFREFEPQSRYLRFFGIRNSLTTRELSRLSELDSVTSGGLVATAGGSARKRIVGVAHYLDSGVPGCAEFVCDVIDDYQGLGIATILGSVSVWNSSPENMDERLHHKIN